MMNFFKNIGENVMKWFDGVNFKAFADNLKYMGIGMLGIFVVIVAIILVITILQKFSRDDNAKQ